MPLLEKGVPQVQPIRLRIFPQKIELNASNKDLSDKPAIIHASK
jgi:hypothetical protein